MQDIMDGTTVGAVFATTVAAHADRPFLAVPARSDRDYLPNGFAITYGAAASEVDRLTTAYCAAGYGAGHRVATLLENRPEYVLHKLALNTLGACCVPINPDYRAGEIAYLLDHAEPDLVLALARRTHQITLALDQAGHRPPVVVAEDFDTALMPPSRRAEGTQTRPETPASILYTSGTTGRPKGCILSHGYEVATGAWYAALPGIAGLRRGEDRIYNPLPLYHANSGVISLFGTILTGNCQIQPDRFHPLRWWREIVETRATVVHYLGITSRNFIKRLRAILLTHPDVQQAAVLAVKDDMREEEVLACIVLNRDLPAAEAASALFERCFERLAYYKAPGWIDVLPTLPTTGTQKIQKHNIYPGGTDPRTAPGIIDLRKRKRRG